uniref:Uncharacterized protein n=1 Tax=Romanomermis culicivorax TaxID=13658 RepID=A0A915JBV0_ROMCU
MSTRTFWRSRFRDAILVKKSFLDSDNCRKNCICAIIDAQHEPKLPAAKKIAQTRMSKTTAQRQSRQSVAFGQRYFDAGHQLNFSVRRKEMTCWYHFEKMKNNGTKHNRRNVTERKENFCSVPLGGRLLSAVFYEIAFIFSDRNGGGSLFMRDPLPRQAPAFLDIGISLDIRTAKERLMPTIPEIDAKMDLEAKTRNETQRLNKGNYQDVATLAILESVQRSMYKSTNAANIE